MRSIWNGSISFGLVTIPIKMYSASEDRKLDLDMLDSHDHARIRYKRVNENTGKGGEWKDIVKGYKIDDSYVILENDNFDKANMKKSKTLELEAFIREEEVTEDLYKKQYFLEPHKEGNKCKNLVRDALKKTKKLGLATFVMRQKENLCLIGVYNDIMVAHIIRFSDEIRDGADLQLPKTKVSKKEVDMALTLIEQYTEKFDFKKYKDVYNDQLLKIIHANAKGTKSKMEKFESKATPAKDLMAQLKASLERRKKES